MAPARRPSLRSKGSRRLRNAWSEAWKALSTTRHQIATLTQLLSNCCRYCLGDGGIGRSPRESLPWMDATNELENRTLDSVEDPRVSADERDAGPVPEERGPLTALAINALSVVMGLGIVYASRMRSDSWVRPDSCPDSRAGHVRTAVRARRWPCDVGARIAPLPRQHLPLRPPRGRRCSWDWCSCLPRFWSSAFSPPPCSCSSSFAGRPLMKSHVQHHLERAERGICRSRVPGDPRCAESGQLPRMGCRSVRLCAPRR